ncbi:MAG TPA: FAD-dependent oxidoreductase [Burkholderiaceae bacterium]|nr:FAD-dependent oxidoreductase [Burkholderiaceae bacterium]
MPEDPVVLPLAPITKVAGVTTGGAYELPVYPFVEPAELRGKIGRHAVVVVGAGLAGLTAACDLALHGVPVVVLDEDDTVGVRGASSRGICYAQKSLEIFKRLGIYERIAARGVSWSVGRTLAGSDEIFSFDLKSLPTFGASEQPPFINLQQFYIEWFLVDRIYELGTVDLRWKNRLIGCEQRRDAVVLHVETPAGHYELESQWVIDCSGSHSALRSILDVPVQTEHAVDRWCISDVRFRARPPAERWTWIRAPFNDGRAVWQHLMGDDVWRLDYQMAPDADPEQFSQPAVVADRLQRQFGAGVDYELVWVGPYSYRGQCLETFRVGRVFFAGDAAHVMSPFGARGGNSGIQDADNLVWKLAFVLEGKAPERLLDSYDAERRPAALQNIRITTRTTRFLSPQAQMERILREAVISLAREYAFARGFVNTGRLSSPSHYAESPLNVGPGGGRSVQNIALTLPDGKRGDLVDLLEYAAYRVLGLVTQPVDRYFAQELELLEQRYPVRFFRLQTAAVETSALPTVIDADEQLSAELGIAASCACLLRPDLHLAGSLDEAGAPDIEQALRKLLAQA